MTMSSILRFILFTAAAAALAPPARAQGRIQSTDVGSAKPIDANSTSNSTNSTEDDAPEFEPFERLYQGIEARSGDVLSMTIIDAGEGLFNVTVWYPEPTLCASRDSVAVGRMTGVRLPNAGRLSIRCDDGGPNADTAYFSGNANYTYLFRAKLNPGAMDVNLGGGSGSVTIVKLFRPTSEFMDGYYQGIDPRTGSLLAMTIAYNAMSWMYDVLVHNPVDARCHDGRTATFVARGGWSASMASPIRWAQVPSPRLKTFCADHRPRGGVTDFDDGPDGKARFVGNVTPGLPVRVSIAGEVVAFVKQA